MKQAWRPGERGSWQRDLLLVLGWLWTFAMFVGAWILVLTAGRS